MIWLILSGICIVSLSYVILAQHLQIQAARKQISHQRQAIEKLQSENDRSYRDNVRLIEEWQRLRKLVKKGE